MNLEVYNDEKTRTLIMLNKISKGRGATFMEGWYLKLVDDTIPKSEKSLKKLCRDFKEAFILKDLQDQAHQTIYSLTMDQF